MELSSYGLLPDQICAGGNQWSYALRGGRVRAKLRRGLKAATAPQGWPHIEWPSSRAAMADMPDEFYRLIMEAAEE